MKRLLVKHAIRHRLLAVQLVTAVTKGNMGCSNHMNFGTELQNSAKLFSVTKISGHAKLIRICLAIATNVPEKCTAT